MTLNPSKRAHRIATRLLDKDVRVATHPIMGRNDGKAPLRAHEFYLGYFCRADARVLEDDAGIVWRSTAPEQILMLHYVVYARKRKRKQVEKAMAVIKSVRSNLLDSIEDGTAMVLHSPDSLDHIVEWARGVLLFEGFDLRNHNIGVRKDPVLSHL